MVVSQHSAKHPALPNDVSIHDLLNDMSWLREDSMSAITEDDELHKEIDMLASAEREVSEELSEVVQMFRKESEKRNMRTLAKNCPRKLNSAAYSLPKTYIDVRKYGHEVELSLSNHERSFKKKKRGKISNIHEVDIRIENNDTRDSPEQSQPSDEACNGVLSVSLREAPEEIEFFTDEETGDIEDATQSCKSLSVDESGEKIQPTDHNCIDTSKQFEEKQRLPTLSGWSQKSCNSTDLEKGQNNLFEEEAFWEEGLWKIPAPEPASTNPSDTVDPKIKKSSKNEAPNDRKIPNVPRSRREIVDILSLPTLDCTRDGEGESNMKVDCLIEKLEEESNGDCFDVVIEDVYNNIAQSRKAMEQASLPSKLDQYSPNVENQLRLQTQTPCVPHKLVHDKNSREGMVVLEKKRIDQRNDRCNWRAYVLGVHIILTVIGGAIFWVFFRIKNTKDPSLLDIAEAP